MSKLTEETKRLRKQYAAAGQAAQKMMSFRLDNDNAEWLNTKPNKGRYINELIAQDRTRSQG